jgi:hypothetical protein
MLTEHEGSIPSFRSFSFIQSDVREHEGSIPSFRLTKRSIEGGAAVKRGKADRLPPAA